MRWWTGFLSNFGMVMMNCFRYSFWYGSLVRRKLVCTFLYNLFCPSLYRLVLSYPQRVRRPLTYWLIFVQRIFSFFLSIILICAYHIKEGNTRHLSDQQASTERLTLVGFPIPFPCHYRHYKCLHLSVFPYDDQFPETSYDNRGGCRDQPQDRWRNLPREVQIKLFQSYPSVGRFDQGIVLYLFPTKLSQSKKIWSSFSSNLKFHFHTGSGT